MVSYMYTHMNSVFSSRSMRLRVAMYARGVHPRRPSQLLAVAWRVATPADRRPLAGINVTRLMMPR
jgi:hypothetical protein